VRKETITLYSGDDEFIVNADEVGQYLKQGLTKKKGTRKINTIDSEQPNIESK